MKKFVSLLLVVALIACLCACGTQPAQTQQSEQQPAQNEPAAPAEAFGAELEAHSEGNLQRMLDQLVEQATAK